MIEPFAWDARAEGVPNATSEEDYAMAANFDFSAGEIAAPQNSLMAIYDVYNNLGKNPFDISEGDVDLSEFDWIIIHKEALRSELKSSPEPRVVAIAEMEQLAKEDSPHRNKIYESNSFFILKLRE